MSVWIGVDPGEKRNGLARADGLGVLATPRGVVGNRDDLVSWILETDSEHGVAGVVIGMPRNMDGSFGPMAIRSLQLVRWLRERIDFPVQLWDERLTSAQAKALGGSKELDARAAAILLQSFLDAGAPDSPDPPGLLEAADGAN
ncbi:MAG: Holliday junction resolvase RuvX [Bacillota bacterium]|nr:MAG: Holliday junction resolvase RuvX [Planctomycetota bacterium]RUA08071.1 MAG: Holliday junction resolvase RuvX [Bacillota bacterium]